MKSLILAGAMLTLVTAGAAPTLADDAPGWRSHKAERFDRIDRNDNGRIGPYERAAAARRFDRIDRNDNGRIGPRERAAAARRFDRIDRNDNGRIDPRERLRLQ